MCPGPGYCGSVEGFEHRGVMGPTQSEAIRVGILNKQ